MSDKEGGWRKQATSAFRSWRNELYVQSDWQCKVFLQQQAESELFLLPMKVNGWIFMTKLSSVDLWWRVARSSFRCQWRSRSPRSHANMQCMRSTLPLNCCVQRSTITMRCHVVKYTIPLTKMDNTSCGEVKRQWLTKNAKNLSNDCRVSQASVYLTLKDTLRCYYSIYAS